MQHVLNKAKNEVQYMYSTLRQLSDTASLLHTQLLLNLGWGFVAMKLPILANMSSPSPQGALHSLLHISLQHGCKYCMLTFLKPIQV